MCIARNTYSLLVQLRKRFDRGKYSGGASHSEVAEPWPSELLAADSTPLDMQLATTYHPVQYNHWLVEYRYFHPKRNLSV